jgi:hypothetical protein
MATIKQELQAAHDKFYQELDQLLELLAAQQRLVGRKTGKSESVLQQGETAEAQAVLAALKRVASP